MQAFNLPTEERIGVELSAPSVPGHKRCWRSLFSVNYLFCLYVTDMPHAFADKMRRVRVRKCETVRGL